jgi:hypothetical protein
MIETEYRRIPTCPLSEIAIKKLSRSILKPSTTMLGTNNPGLVLDEGLEEYNEQYRFQEQHLPPKPTLIVEQLRPMNDIYNDIEKNKKYFPGHYHKYMGENKVYPQPDNSGTIKAFFPNHYDKPIFPDTMLKEVYTEQEKIDMAKDIERKNNLSKPIYRFKPNKINLSRFNTRNDDDNSTNNSTNSNNENNFNNDNNKTKRRIRYFDRKERSNIINTTSTKPDIITSNIDGKVENDIIMRWNYLNKGTTTNNNNNFNNNKYYYY